MSNTGQAGPVMIEGPVLVCWGKNTSQYLGDTSFSANSHVRCFLEYDLSRKTALLRLRVGWLKQPQRSKTAYIWAYIKPENIQTASCMDDIEPASGDQDLDRAVERLQSDGDLICLALTVKHPVELLRPSDATFDHVIAPHRDLLRELVWFTCRTSFRIYMKAEKLPEDTWQRMCEMLSGHKLSAPPETESHLATLYAGRGGVALTAFKITRLLGPPTQTFLIVALRLHQLLTVARRLPPPRAVNLTGSEHQDPKSAAEKKILSNLSMLHTGKHNRTDESSNDRPTKALRQAVNGPGSIVSAVPEEVTKGNQGTASLSKDVKTCIRDVASLCEEVANGNQAVQLKLLNQKVDKSNRDVASLREEVKNSNQDAQLQLLHQKVDMSNRDVAFLRKEVMNGNQDAQLQLLHQKVKGNRDAAVFRETLAHLYEAVEHANQVAASLGQETSALRAEVEQAKRDVASARDESAALRAEVGRGAQATASLRDVREENTALREEIAGMRERVVQADRDLAWMSRWL